jgi:hypothetical protein
MQAPQDMAELENFLSGQSVTGFSREQREGYKKETAANQLPAE